MYTIILVVLAGIAGLVLGATAHASIAKEAAASKEELAKWAGQLRYAASADAQIAKAKLMALAVEIENKL
jgi:hypothetical protein